MSRKSSRRLGVYIVSGGYSVRDLADGAEVWTATSDPLAAVVDAAEALGLPWVKTHFNREDDPPKSGPIIRVEAATGHGRPPVLNPVEQRRKAQERKAKREKRGGAFVAELGPRAFGERVQPDTPSRFPDVTRWRGSPEREALCRQVYGSAYWRSPQMAADCHRLYGGKDTGYWGRKLDERIAQAWLDADIPRRAARDFQRARVSMRNPLDRRSAAELFMECVRLAPYSRRLRALGKMWERRGIAEVPADSFYIVTRLLKDIRIKIGEPVNPDVYFPPEATPRTSSDSLRFLQHPELFDTESYAGMSHAALWPPEGLGHPELRPFAERLVKLAKERGVPLFVELAYVSAEKQTQAYVEGRTPVPPGESPHAAGRAVRIGHAVGHDWPGQTLDWLHQLADLAAAHCGVRIGYSAADPGQFILADDDGALMGSMSIAPRPPADDEWQDGDEAVIDIAKRLSQRAKPGEADAMLAFYGGKADGVPWPTFGEVRPMVGKSGRFLPGSDGPVSYDCRVNPETGRHQVVELFPDGNQRFVEAFEPRSVRPSEAKRSQGERGGGVQEE